MVVRKSYFDKLSIFDGSVNSPPSVPSCEPKFLASVFNTPDRTIELCYTLGMKAVISLVLRTLILPLSLFISVVPLTRNFDPFLEGGSYFGIKGLPIPYTYQTFPTFPTNQNSYLFALDFFICFLALNVVLDVWYEKKFILRNFIFILILSLLISLVAFFLVPAIGFS